MINVLEFFKMLPKKKCRECGVDMDELADCYINLCDECHHPAR
ncbi:MAG TPA: protein YhfH [Virgibacillus sp.]|nr:protein YhfH [Virgibacillus sp.]